MLEVAFLHLIAMSHIILCRTDKVDTLVAAIEITVPYQQGVCTTRIEQRRCRHERLAGTYTLSLSEVTVVELASHCVGTHTHQIGGTALGGVATEIDSVETHIPGLLHIDDSIGKQCRTYRRCWCVEQYIVCRAATHRLKLHIVDSRCTRNEGDDYRTIIGTRSQFDSQNAIDTALADSVEELVE